MVIGHNLAPALKHKKQMPEPPQSVAAHQSSQSHGRLAPTVQQDGRTWRRERANCRLRPIEDAILCELPPALRRDVGLFLCHTAVARSELFATLPRDALARVVGVLKARVPSRAPFLAPSHAWRAGRVRARARF